MDLKPFKQITIEQIRAGERAVKEDKWISLTDLRNELTMKHSLTAKMALELAEEAVQSRTADLSKGDKLVKKLNKAIVKAASTGETSLDKTVIVFNHQAVYCAEVTLRNNGFTVWFFDFFGIFYTFKVIWESAR